MRRPIEPTELANLEQLFGAIPRRPERLELPRISQKHWWPILERDRRAEVVLILPRPAGRLVLIRKSDYPAGVFRLPTGGVDPDEDVLTAATREAFEETGLEVRPERLLGIVDWVFTYRGQERTFASYLCLFPVTDRPLQATDPTERISDYQECSQEELAAIATRLKQLPLDWKSWGQQRAVPHELALALLASPK